MQSLAQIDAPHSSPAQLRSATHKKLVSSARPLSHFEILASRVPDVQAPALPRRGQRDYLARCRRIYSRELIRTGLNRVTRRALAKHMKLAVVPA